MGKPRRKTGSHQEPQKEGSGVAREEEVRYAEINRAVTAEEIGSVRKAAEAVGLWRFCDPPGHDGFNL